MKKTILTLLGLLGMGGWLCAQSVSAPITGVKVYLDRASIRHSGSIWLPEGPHSLKITGLSDHLVEESLQLGAGQARIELVSFRRDFLYQQPKPKALLQLEDSLRLVEERLRQLQDEILLRQQEVKTLHANEKMERENGLLLSQLQAMAQLYRTRLFELAEEESLLGQQRTELAETQARLKRQLEEYARQRQQARKEIEIRLYQPTAGQLNLEMEYLVTHAGWAARYDLRTPGISDPVSLTLYADVRNHTGIDWVQVPLELSTAQPSSSATAPKLQPWVVSIYYPQPPAPAARMCKAEMAAPAQTEESREEYDFDGENPGIASGEAVAQLATADAFTQTMQTDLSVEYRIALKYDIPSDGQAHKVQVKTHALPATYRYYALPRQDPTAYLEAELANWQGVELLPGPATVYLAQQYVSETYLNPRTTQDTLKLGLGPDEQVQIDYQTLENYTRRNSLGTQKTVGRSYRISVRNNKTLPISLVITEPHPVSTNNKIEVELTEHDADQYDPQTGKLVWARSLQPGGSLQLKHRFDVRHPADMRVDGL
jgi:uncharacterized protein (TIGR02231 family)